MSVTFPEFAKEEVYFDDAGKAYSKLTPKTAKGRTDAVKGFIKGTMKMALFVPRGQAAPAQS